MSEIKQKQFPSIHVSQEAGFIVAALKDGKSLPLIRIQGNVYVGVPVSYTNSTTKRNYALYEVLHFKETDCQTCVCDQNCTETIYMYNGCGVKYRFCLNQVGKEFDVDSGK